MSYSSYGDHKPANALLSSLPTPPPHNNISSTTIDSNRSYTASASAINRTDPFSRLLSSLDEPTFDSAGISGEDSVFFQLLSLVDKQRLLIHTFHGRPETRNVELSSGEAGSVLKK